MISKDIIQIAVTGGGGQISYSLLFRIASGELLGPKQKIALSIRDVEENRLILEAMAMELEDCAFPLLQNIKIGSDPYKVFEDVDLAFLVGAKPRGPGMERRDLLLDNAKIFVEEGKALNEVASKDVKVLVVGNPCNTNCLIAMSHASRIPRKNFHAMMRLDHNRAIALLAKKAKASVTDVRQMVVWGNHSATQVPDTSHVLINNKAAGTLLEKSWLTGEFVETVQRRGAAIIAARGKSSAGSAAHAALFAMKALFEKTPSDDWFSTAVCSDGNSYGIEENLVFGFPCRSKGEGDHEIVQGLDWDFFVREKIAITQKELLEERECVKAILGKS